MSELEMLERDSWEQTRMIMWSIIQVNSKDKLKPTDVLSLPWDTKDEAPSVTQSDIDEFKKRNNIT